jgi:hypothetical protein
MKRYVEARSSSEPGDFELAQALRALRAKEDMGIDG